MPTSSEHTVSPKNNTTNCTNASRAAAQFAYDTLKSSPGDSPLTITIKRERSEASSVTTVTIDSSEGIQTRNFSDEWLRILKKEPGGSSLRKRKRKENVE